MERNPRQTTIPYSNPNPRVNIPIRNYYPERIVNPALIQELFLRISEGDLFRLKDFILTNDVTLYLKDEHGNSVLHQVIKNRNFTKSEKLEIINFLIDRGAPIMAYNDENITPLHLAAKYQLEDVIDLLIQRGADPNATDNQFMTPLHYAVQGYNTDCKSLRKIKIDNLINNVSVKPNEIIWQLGNSLRDYLYYNEYVNQYFIHIKNTFNNFSYIYTPEYDRLKENLRNDLNKILSDTSLTKNKLEQSINTKISNLKEDIEKNLLNKLDETLKSLDIKPNQKSGPNNNNIFPYNSIKDYNENFLGNNRKLSNTFNDNVNNKLNKLNDSFNKLFDITENTLGTIKNLYWYNAGFYINTNNPSNNLAFNMKKYLAESPEKMLLFDIALDIYNDTILDDSNVTYNLIDLTSVNNISWVQINGQAIDTLKIDKIFNIRDAPKNIKRGKVNEVNNSKADYTDTTVTDDRVQDNPNSIIRGTWGRKVTLNNLNNSHFISIVPKFDGSGNIIPIPDQAPINDNAFTIPNPDPNGNSTSTADSYGYIDYDYTLVSKMRYYIKRIQLYLRYIGENNTKIQNMKSYNYYYYIPNIISLNVVYIINCLIYLKLIDDELKDIKTKITQLENLFDIKFSQQGLQNFSHIFYLDIARNACKNLLNLYNSFETSNIFKQIVSFLNDYNTFIEYINGTSLFNYINLYNNKFITQPRIYTRLQQTSNFYGLFTNIINRINTMDLEYDKFINMFTTNNINSENASDYNNPSIVDNIKKIKKQLIENYIPQISDLNKKDFIRINQNTAILNFFNMKYTYNNLVGSSNINLINNINAIIGNKRNNDGLRININFRSLDINPNNNPISTLNLELFEKGFIFNTSISDPENNNFIKDNYNDTFDKLTLIRNVRPKLINGEIAKIGKIGVIDMFHNLKTESALPIISYDINLHFKIIKYQIIEYVVNKIYEFLTNNSLSLGPYETKIKNLMIDYDNYIKSNVDINQNPQDLSIVLSTVGKLLDSIINTFIREKIHLASIHNSDLIINQYSNAPNRNISDIFNNIIFNSTYREILPNEDFGFKLHLNEIINEVLNSFLTPNLNQEKINESYQLNFTSLILDENIFDRKNIVALYNYSLNSQKIIKQCYSINENVISKLVTKTQVNKKDFAGNTPLFYAIETQNIDVINMLINNRANVNINPVSNNIGLTPLDFAKNLYNAHVTLLNQSNNLITSLTNPLYEKMRDVIRQNPQYKNNILKYSDIFLPQILVLLNHYLFIQTKNYPKNWSFTKMQKLSNIITGNDNSLINPKLPLLDINEERVKTIGISGTDVFLDKKNKINMQINQINEKIKELNNTNSNLLLESNSIRNNSNFTEMNRVTEINNLIDANNIEINKYQNFINNLNNTLTNLNNNKNLIENNNNSSNIFKIMNNSYGQLDNGNVISIYNSVFWKILNSKPSKLYSVNLDFRSYPALMKDYIFDYRINNIYVIHPYLQTYVFDLLFNRNINQETIDKINLVSDLYDNVFFPIAKDYEELPLEYNNSNYVLKQSIDIIAHSLKHTIITSMYHSIVKTITKYVKTLNPPSSNTNNNNTSLKYNNDVQYSEFLNKTVENIINNGRNESVLIKYIFDFMPIKLIKLTLNIYDGENDPDKIYNRDGLYEEIIKILMSNTVIPITEDTSLIKNIRDILIPYFKDYNNLFINEAINLTNGYFGYILSESKLLKIISILLSQSMIENNKV